MLILGVLLCVVGVFGFIFKYNHVISVLLSVEIFVLGLMCFLFMWLMNDSVSELFYLMSFISVVVGEGVLGLSILVSIVRWHGGDNYLGLHSLIC